MNRKWWLINGILIGLIFAHAVNAFGQPLPTVAPETNWTWIGIAVGCVFLIAGLIWWIRDRPGAVAKAKEEVPPGVHGMFEHVVSQFTNALESHTEAIAKLPAAPADGITLPGKAGTPGTFVLTVTGDPAVDLPAINAQYFGTAP